MVVAATGMQIGRNWSWRAAAGALLGGTLTHDGRTHDVGTGWLVSASGARSFAFGPKRRFFATANLTFAMSSTSTREMVGGVEQDSVSLMAMDTRIGALFGVTLGERFSPYLLARGFGGPISWALDGQDITGTDQHHYQLGAGMTVALPKNSSVLVDVSLLGERSLSVGVSLTL